MRASKKSTLKSGKRHYLGSGICFKLQMSLSVTLLMMLIACLLIQLSILAGSCCGWRKLWKRIRSSAVAPINHDQQIELADASAANSSRNNNSVQSEEFVIITNCFITYTALLIYCILCQLYSVAYIWTGNYTISEKYDQPVSLCCNTYIQNLQE